MKLLMLCLTSCLVFYSTISAASDEDWQQYVDFSLADKNPISMSLINNDKPAGSMTYTWRRDGNTYVIEDRTEMQPNILETATGVLDVKTLMPISVDIDFAVGENHTVFDLEWNDSALSGQITINQKDQPERIVPVDSDSNAVLRLAIFGVISALPLADGFDISLPWFNTLSNKLETVSITHAGIESVTTPAGTFEAHKLNLTGGSPENIVYVTTALPQKIVRIDVVGQPLYFVRNASS